MHTAATPVCISTSISLSSLSRRYPNRKCTVRHTSWPDHARRIARLSRAESHSMPHFEAHLVICPSPPSTASNLQLQHRSLNRVSSTAQQRLAMRPQPAMSASDGNVNGFRDDDKVDFGEAEGRCEYIDTRRI